MIVSVSEITHDTTITCEVPRLAIDLADELTLRLLHPNAELPRAITDVDDERILAVAVERIVLRWYGELAGKGDRTSGLETDADPNEPPDTSRRPRVGRPSLDAGEAATPNHITRLPA